jgi:hypothetical protein
MKDYLKNWKTTLAGVVAFLMSVPAFVSALQAWGAHQAVDLRSVFISVALTAGGVGLMAAKDSTTHSTPAEVTQAGQDAAAPPKG